MLTAILFVLAVVFLFLFCIGLFMGFAASMADGQVGVDAMFITKWVTIVGAVGLVVVAIIGLWRAFS